MSAQGVTYIEYLSSMKLTIRFNATLRKDFDDKAGCQGQAIGEQSTYATHMRSVMVTY